MDLHKGLKNVGQVVGCIKLFRFNLNHLPVTLNRDGYAQGMKAFSIRLPDDVADKLLAIANFECRSMNQQIEFALRLFLAAYEMHPKLKVNLDRTPGAQLGDASSERSG